jgi:hypothetical protein
MAWHGKERYGKAWNKERHGMAWQGESYLIYDFEIIGKRTIGKSYLIYDFEIIAYLYHIDQISVHLKLERPT